MKIITLIMMLFAFNLHAVDFVIPEVQAKFDSIDSSISGITALADGKIIVGNASGVAADVAMSGDATIANTGALTIAAGAVEESMLAVGTADGLNAYRVARATWDFSEHGGAQTAIGLGVTLPAKSIIEHAYFYTVTQVTDGGTGTGALSCEDANNLYSAADVTGNAAGTLVEGAPDGDVANFVTGIASACELTWTIAGADATAGKLNFYVRYTVHD